VDAAGNLYIADTGNGRVRKVSNGVITTIAGNGTFGFAGDGGPATNAEFYAPLKIAVDASGRVYVADTNNSRIRVLIPDSDACASTPPGPPGGRTGAPSLAAPCRTVGSLPVSPSR